MNKYEVIYESLQNQLDQGLITTELAEEVNDLAYDKYVVEDKSDIARNYSEDMLNQSYRSMRHVSKRPKITKNMSDENKKKLHGYDHGESKHDISKTASRRKTTNSTIYSKKIADMSNDSDRSLFEDMIAKNKQERELHKDMKYAYDIENGRSEKEKKKLQMKANIKKNIKAGLRQSKNAFIPHKTLK